MIEQSVSVTSVRGRLRALMCAEAASEVKPRDIVILAVDGIPFDLASSAWRRAKSVRLEAVSPTTSSTGWLSSLTGATVQEHGIPGVVFRNAGGLINIFEFRGDLAIPETGNIFSDARNLGFDPVAVPGDWEPYPCSWRDALLREARCVWNWRFYTEEVEPSPQSLADKILQAITAARATGTPSKPKLVWCFIDADRHIHRSGYDAEILDFLERLDALASDLNRTRAVVVAHSDHGLVATMHDVAIEQTLEALQQRYAFEMGGAGRVRWLYAQDECVPQLLAECREMLPEDVEVSPVDQYFPELSPIRPKIGEILLISHGEHFLASPGHYFDHGSFDSSEVYVPFSLWTPAEPECS